MFSPNKPIWKLLIVLHFFYMVKQMKVLCENRPGYNYAFYELITLTSLDFYVHINLFIVQYLQNGIVIKLCFTYNLFFDT